VSSSSPWALTPCASSLLGSLHGALRTLDAERPLAEVAALSGLAFRLQVDAEISLASAHAFPWAEELPAALSRLGHDCELLHLDETDPLFGTAAATRRILELAGRGVAIAWGIHLPEFGVVTGVEGPRLRVSGVLDGRGGGQWLDAARLGRADLPVTFVLRPLARRGDHDEGVAEQAALVQAIRLLGGASARMGGFVGGAAAWEAWSTAMRSGRLDPTGHAYLAQIVAEGRTLGATWLERVGSSAAASLRRSAEALCELAAAWPYPVPDGGALPSRARDEHARLLDACAEAERDARASLERALDGRRRARAAAVTLEEVDRSGELFACVRDLPLAGLEQEADELRGHHQLRAKIAREGADVVGHVYYADLADSGAAVKAKGRWLYIYCAWVAQDRRGAGIGRRLFDALMAEVIATGYQGLLVEATAQPMFLHHGAYEALGFEEVDRLEDEIRLLSLPPGAPAELARSAQPSSLRLPVVVAEGRPCPLLLRAARNLASAAHACDVELIERKDPPHGIEIGGRRLPLQYVPREAALTALPEAARAWKRRG
jgi:ribosomal protein S18 acetylase RimI-like enzyme